MTSFKFPNKYMELMTLLVNNVRCQSQFPDKDLAIFWPHVGNRYAGARIKLMIVGRAPNGTGLCSIPSSPKSLDAMFEEHRSDGQPTSGDHGWVLWMGAEGSEVRSTYFWQFVKKAFDALNPARNGSSWWTEIAWSNLYKIAPQAPKKGESGNPDPWLKNAQLTGELVQQILRLEIDTLDPDVVVCITGHTWMHEFWHEPRNNPLGVNWSDEYDWNESIHKMTREPQENGRRERFWMVVRRPEFQKNEVAITPIVNALSRWREDPKKVFDENGNWKPNLL